MNVLRLVVFATAIVATIPLAACGPTLASCNGTQQDHDDAKAACDADAQKDVCAGSAKGTSYDPSSHDVCNDGIPDQAGKGCEDGYDASFDRGCDAGVGQ